MSVLEQEIKKERHTTPVVKQQKWFNLIFFDEDIMRIITLLLLLVIADFAYAEVYKCHTVSKQTVYQSTPCSPDSADKNIVNIPKLDTHQLEEAEIRLKATETERQALDKVEQERQEAATAKWQAEAPQRAAAAARQEEEARQQTIIRSNPYPVFIPYPNYNYGYPYNQNSVTNRKFSPYNPSYDLLPNPAINPSFSPYSTPYPPTYMPSPVFPSPHR
jgi:hypothetical protein